jgi:hypothetical protein
VTTHGVRGRNKWELSGRGRVGMSLIINAENMEKSQIFKELFVAYIKEALIKFCFSFRQESIPPGKRRGEDSEKWFSQSSG